MARPSPGAQRVIALLNFFADNPGRPFSLTDLIRALKVNRSTLHSLLAELVEANYLFRTNDKLYVLGSAVARLGSVASQNLSPLQVAHSEMRAIADEFGIVCSALFRDREDVVVRDRAASATKHDWYPAPPYRFPLRLPAAPLFMLWSPQSELEAWLTAVNPPLLPNEKQIVADGLTFVKQNGFQFAVWRQGDDQQHAPEQVFPARFYERELLTGTSLDPEASYPVASLTSPVRDAQGRVAFILSLSAFDGNSSGAEVARMGQRVRQASGNISQFLGGTPV